MKQLPALESTIDHVEAAVLGMMNSREPSMWPVAYVKALTMGNLMERCLTQENNVELLVSMAI